MVERTFVACLVALALPAAARAETPTARVIVLETHVGQRPDDVVEPMSELRDAFEALGLAAQPSTIMPLLDRSGPYPGIMDKGASSTALTVAELVEPVDQGYIAWSRVKFADAKKLLTWAKPRLKRNPALLVTDTGNLSVKYKALAALSLTELQLGESAAASDVMQELFRAFPSQPLSPREYSPDAREFYQNESQVARAKGTGRLRVNAGNEQAVIFVDNQIRGIGHADLKGVAAGPHDVFVQVPATLGRRWDIDVIADRDNLLNVMWELDMALWISDDWVGFLFATETDRAKVAAFAAELTQRWHCAGIIAVAPARVHGKSAMVGAMYDTTGKVIRKANVALEANHKVLLRALAAFLANGIPAEGVNVMVERDDAPDASDLGVDGPRRPLLGPALVLGSGAVALGVGAWVFEMSSQYRGLDKSHTDGQWVGIDIAVGGSAVIGGGIYLLLHQRYRAGRLAAACLGSGIAALSAGTIYYLVHQEKLPGLPPIVRDTKPAAVGLGIGGLAATGAGLLLWHHDRGQSSVPLVAIQSGGGTISWAGRF